MGTTGSPDGALMVQWFFGGLVVVFYAVHRFNEPRQDPRPARSTTTFWRYWSACGGYVVAMLGLFIVLGGGIGAIDPRILMPLIDPSPVPADARALPGPLLSALLLTSLLPHFPGLGKIDASVKRWFQDVGNIPWEVRELSRFLRDSAYAPRARGAGPGARRAALARRRRGLAARAGRHHQAPLGAQRRPLRPRAALGGLARLRPLRRPAPDRPARDPRADRQAGRVPRCANPGRARRRQRVAAGGAFAQGLRLGAVGAAGFALQLHQRRRARGRAGTTPGAATPWPSSASPACRRRAGR